MGPRAGDTRGSRQVLPAWQRAAPPAGNAPGERWRLPERSHTRSAPPPAASSVRPAVLRTVGTRRAGLGDGVGATTPCPPESLCLGTLLAPHTADLGAEFLQAGLGVKYPPVALSEPGEVGGDMRPPRSHGTPRHGPLCSPSLHVGCFVLGHLAAPLEVGELLLRLVQLLHCLQQLALCLLQALDALRGASAGGGQASPPPSHGGTRPRSSTFLSILSLERRAVRAASAARER